MRSLTKSAAPGLRVAAVSARGAAGARLRAARIIDDFFVAGPLQHATLELVSSPAWRRHLQGAARRAARAPRRAASPRSASTCRTGRSRPSRPAACTSGSACPTALDDVALTARAAAAGVLVSPGRPWFAAEPPGPHLRLTFGGAPPPDLAEGVRRLAAAAAPAS